MKGIFRPDKGRIKPAPRKISAFLLLVLVAVSFSSLFGVAPADAATELTVTPLAWNIVGLDSNDPATGPYRFPVGARICNTGSTDAGNVTADYIWDDGHGVFVGDVGADPYINLRAGSLSSVAIGSIAAGACTDVYYETEVTRVAGSFDKTRRYHITAIDSVSGVTGMTPTPRELYVEYLISQSRNSINDIKLDGVSIPAGGAMTLMVGNTYTIDLVGSTATQGYNQFEAFVNFPNTIFQILAVSTTYSANNSPYVGNPNDKLYADACLWENDPNSPNYRSCVGGDFKAGGSVTTSYRVRILSGGGSSETLNSLLYDFSGSSYHYNADYGVGARIANIVDPTNVTITKNFSPNPTNVNGISSLTINLTNPNPGPISGYNFADPLPADVVVADPPNATTTSCGTPILTAVAGASSISFADGTLAANSSCTVKVNVTPTATGSFTNTTDHLFINTLDTGKFATATLDVNTTPPPPPPPSTCAVPSTLATWTMPAAGQGSGGPPPPYTTKAADVATADASYTTVSGTDLISATIGNPVNAWGGTAPTGGGGWAETANSMNNYFQFTLDTSKYGGVFASIDIRPHNAGDWGNPNSNVYINTSADGGPFTPYTPAPTVPKNAWTTVPINAVPTGTMTTIFRIGVDSGSKASSTLYLDNIIFMGCPVLTPPAISKEFSPNPIAVNGVSTLTFTLTNPNESNALDGVTFTDTLPDGLKVAATPNATTTCGGTPTWAPAADDTTFTFGAPNGATIPLSGSCTVSVDVTATAAGAYQNVSGFISSTNGGTNTGATGSASASLTVVKPPSIDKMFAPNPILAGGTSTLTFTIINPNQNDTLSGLALTDTFPNAPGAMTVADPLTTTNTCGGTLWDETGGALAAGDAGISLTGGMVVGGSTCTVTVEVTAPTVGDYANTSGPVSSTNGGTGNSAADTLTVSPPAPAISTLKQSAVAPAGPWFSFIAVPTGNDVFYQFTVQNDGDVPLSLVDVIDPLVSTAGCSWEDGEGASLSAPFTLPVADADNQHYATCVTGPVSAASGLNPNTATASGSYGGTPYSDASTAYYATTGLTLDKSSTETHFVAEGDVLHYNFLVSNSGFAPLAGPVTIDDDKSSDESCPAVSTVGDGDAFLDPGESVTCTATYTVTAGDVIAGSVTNTAIATADGTDSNLDSMILMLQSASLAVNKPAPVNGDNDGSGTVTLGDLLTYTITATNTGTTTLTNVTVSDPMITPTGGST
ncbi:MAG: DUF11 domain-containing protein, partial [Desulfobulbus sp.]